MNQSQAEPQRHSLNRRILVLMMRSTCLGGAILGGGTLGGAVVLGSGAALAQQAEAVSEYQIAPQPLASAVAAFIRQSGWQISYSSSLVKGMMSPGVSGRLPASAALDRLVAGTGVSVKLSGPQAAALVAQEAAVSDDGEMTLPTIMVQAELAYSGAIDGYLAPASDTGFKAGIPISELPQSISVVTSTELSQRQPQKLDDAIKYVVGVNAGNWGNDPRFDQFAMRGFDMGTGSLYRDGLPQKALGMNGFQIDPYMLERVDVLRGPAGVLYGSNDAGGMVNMVTKRPTFDRLAEVTTSYSTYGTAQLGFDYSNTLNQSGTLAGRLTGLGRDGSTALHGSDNDRSFLAGGLTWAPSSDTTVTFLGHVQYDDLPQSITTPVAGQDYDTSLGTLPGGFYKSQSAFNHFKSQQRSVGWDATHNFSPSVTFNQKFRYGYQKTDSGQLDFNYADADGLHYYSYDMHDRAETYGLDNNIELRQTLAAAENSVVLGFDMQRSWTSSTQYYGDKDYVLSYQNPSFAFPVDDLALSDVTRATYNERGLYVQDHLKFDNGLTATAGLRHSWLRANSTSLMYDTSDTQKDQATTGLLGLTYDMGNGYVPYVSYTEGFTQNIGTTINGDALDPSKSRQWEAGVRYSPEGLPMMITASVFDLRKTNVKDYDMNDPTYSSFTQAGQVQSRGVDLELRGALTDTLQGVVNYSYLDSEITRSSTPDLIGNRAAFAPRNQVSFWLDYDAGNLLPGLGIGAGARYVSAVYEAQENARRTPSYTLADLALHYDAKTYQAALSVSNLFDRDYEGACIADYGCIHGEGRVVTLSLSKKF